MPGAFILAVTNRGHSLLPSFPPVLWKAGHVSAAFAKLAARRKLLFLGLNLNIQQ